MSKIYQYIYIYIFEFLGGTGRTNKFHCTFFLLFKKMEKVQEHDLYLKSNSTSFLLKKKI